MAREELVLNRPLARLGVAGLAIAAIATSVLNKKSPEGSASCQGLNVKVVNSAKHIVALSSKRPLLTGNAESEGTTYVFDDNTPSVTEASPLTTIQHTFPASPAKQKHLITAVPDYSLGEGTFGSTLDCFVKVEFTPNQLSVVATAPMTLHN